MASLSQLIVKISAESSDFDRGIASAQRSALKFSEQLNSIGSTLLKTFTLPLGLLGGAAVKSFGDLDALRRGLEAITGSAGEAARQMTQLREVAKLPGLGFREAVQGAVNLQAVGFSAKASQNILLQFGNALASVGRGREDLNEVIRQLGQLASRGKVTADNLKPIIERVPQVAAIIKREFGTIDTEALQKLGVSSQKFIDVLLKGLTELPRATGGIKNDLENLKDRIDQTLGKLGEAIAPGVSAALAALDPLLTAAGTLSTVFTALPTPIRTATLALAGIAIAAGPILKVVALVQELRIGILALAATDIGRSIATGFTLTTTAAAPAKAAVDAVTAALAATGVSAAGAVTGVEAVAASVTKLSTLALGGIASGIGFGAFLALNELNEFAVKVSTAEKGLGQLNEKFAVNATNTRQSADELQRFVRELANVPIGKNLGEGANTAERGVAQLNARLRQTSDVLRGAKLESFTFFDNFFKSTVNISKNLEDLNAAFGTLGIKAPGVLKGELEKLKGALDSVKKAFKEGAKDANGEAVTMDTVRRATEAYNKELKQLTGTKEAFKRATIPNLIEVEQVARQQAALQGMVKALADFANAGQSFGTKLATVSAPISTLTFQLELLGRNSPEAANRVTAALQELAAIRLPVENLIAYREAVDLKDILTSVVGPLTPLNRLLLEEAEAAIKGSQGTLEFSKRLDEARNSATGAAIAIENVVQALEREFAARNKLKPPQVEINPNLDTRLKGSFLATEQSFRSLGLTATTELRRQANVMGDAWERALEARNAGTGSQADVDATRVAWEKAEIAAAGLTNTVRVQARTLAAVKNEIKGIVSGFSGGLARSIVEWKGLGDAVKNVMKDISASIITFGIQSGLKLLASELSRVTGVVGQLGRALGDIFGASARTASTVSQTAGGAASGAGAAAGGVASGLAGGLSGAIGAVSAVVTAVTSVLQFLQFRRMEQDIGRIEVTTRGELSQLISIQNTLNQYLPNLLNTQLLGSIDSGIRRIYEGLSEVGFTQAGTGGGAINIGTVIFQLPQGSTDDQLRAIHRNLRQIGGRKFAAV